MIVRVWAVCGLGIVWWAVCCRVVGQWVVGRVVARVAVVVAVRAAVVRIGAVGVRVCTVSVSRFSFVKVSRFLSHCSDRFSSLGRGGNGSAMDYGKSDDQEEERQDWLKAQEIVDNIIVLLKLCKKFTIKIKYLPKWAG